MSKGGGGGGGQPAKNGLSLTTNLDISQGNMTDLGLKGAAQGVGFAIGSLSIPFIYKAIAGSKLWKKLLGWLGRGSSDSGGGDSEPGDIFSLDRNALSQAIMADDNPDRFLKQIESIAMQVKSSVNKAKEVKSDGGGNNTND